MADKHTLRRTHSTYQYNRIPLDLEFSEVVRYNLKHADGSREVAVSGVDLLLDDCDAFILAGAGGRVTYGTNYRSGNLNKNGLWEKVLEELETTCISKSERPNKYTEKIETVYTVPVIGHKLFLPPSADDFELGAYHEQREPLDDGLGFSVKLRKALMKKIKRNPAQFFHWEGRYYDATKVYVFKKHLKAIGPNLAPRVSILSPLSATLTTNNTTSHNTPSSSARSVVEFTSNVAFHNSLHKRIHQYCRILHEGQGQGNCDHTYGNTRTGTWEQMNPLDYLEINLGYPRCVTHIGTAGAFPLTDPFYGHKKRFMGRNRPRRYRAEEGEDLDTHKLSHNGNGVKVNKFASYLRVLKGEEENLSWVTSYEVHYRHAVTHKWSLLTVTSANTDAFSEVILDLSPHFNAKDGLFTQYLRIRPLEHNVKPCMRVSVYGVDPRAEARTVSALGEEWREGMRGPDGALTLTSSRTPQEVPTITYALTHSLAQADTRFVRDGLRAYYTRCDYHYEMMERAKTLKRQEFCRLMVQHKKGGDGDI